MSHNYDTEASAADKASIREIRRATTDLEFALMPPPRFDVNHDTFIPDVILIQQNCLRIMMQCSNMIDRHEGTDFAPSLTAIPGRALHA